MLHCALDDHIAITNLPTRPWKMMEGEAVEIFAPTFKHLKPKVARTATSDRHLARLNISRRLRRFTQNLVVKIYGDHLDLRD